MQQYSKDVSYPKKAALRIAIFTNTVPAQASINSPDLFGAAKLSSKKIQWRCSAILTDRLCRGHIKNAGCLFLSAIGVFHKKEMIGNCICSRPFVNSCLHTLPGMARIFPC